MSRQASLSQTPPLGQLGRRPGAKKADATCSVTGRAARVATGSVLGWLRLRRRPLERRDDQSRAAREAHLQLLAPFR